MQTYVRRHANAWRLDHVHDLDENAGTRLVTGIGMGAMLKDKSVGEEILRRSDLEWTIVYASILSDGPASGSVAVLPEGAKRGLSQKISRADVAAWMVKAAAI